MVARDNYRFFAITKSIKLTLIFGVFTKENPHSLHRLRKCHNILTIKSQVSNSPNQSQIILTQHIAYFGKSLIVARAFSSARAHECLRRCRLYLIFGWAWLTQLLWQWLSLSNIHSGVSPSLSLTLVLYRMVGLELCHERD